MKEYDIISFTNENHLYELLQDNITLKELHPYLTTFELVSLCLFFIYKDQYRLFIECMNLLDYSAKAYIKTSSFYKTHIQQKTERLY